MTNSVKIVVFVPETHADKVREAMANAGAGKIANYTNCTFSSKGIGRFKAGEGAHPAIGEVGKIEHVPEERIETICPRENIQKVISAIKSVHPYEEVALDVYPLEDTSTTINGPFGQAAFIYPGIVPPEEGHPTFANFEIVSTGDERGRGLRAKTAFRRGERVARLSGVLINHPTLETIQISPTLHMHDRWFCRFLLHSCDPNLAIDTATMEARAAREIEPGDYLSIDYAATEDVLERQFACRCGSPRCRGWMTGRREQPNEEGRAWLAR